MHDDVPMFMTPILLHSYEDFQKFAQNATAVLYCPEYCSSPFIDDKKKIRTVTLYAVGVMMSKVLLTFKYVLDPQDTCDDILVCEDSDIMASINEFMARLMSSTKQGTDNKNEP